MYNPYRAQQLFKELTQPELPIAIARMNIWFQRCQCGLVTSSADVTYIPSFEPEDKEKFKLLSFAAIRQLDVVALWDAEPQVPYTPLMDALENLLAGLGAYATQLYVKPQLIQQPCSHGT
jgi:hypothetical protein